MKIRNGWVSNSSSSSFIVNKEDLTENQIFILKNQEKTVQGLIPVLDNFLEYFGIDLEELKADSYNYESFKQFEKGDAWEIIETDETLTSQTIIDNFELIEFLRLLQFPMGKIKEIS